MIPLIISVALAYTTVPTRLSSSKSIDECSNKVQSKNKRAEVNYCACKFIAPFNEDCDANFRFDSEKVVKDKT